MRSLILITMLMLVPVMASAEKYYLREDGGSKTECDGKSPVAKNASKKCAWNSIYTEYRSSTTNKDSFEFISGNYTLIARKPDIWITAATFNGNALYYTRAVKSGRRVFISDLDGIAYELKLEKY